MSAGKRAVVIVLDSVGVGALPDAASFGDEGSHTLGHILETIPDLALPNLCQLGLGNIAGLNGLESVADPDGHFGRMVEVSHGKDTATGHWEFVGCVLEEPFQTFMQGFPEDLLDRFVRETGCGGVLGNRAVSGTVIIEELGREHQRTALPIVYTSADPVFQIAAHEDVVDIETLYSWCKVAYDLVIPMGLSRVIARPFVGEWPDFERTHRRKDFTYPPPKPTVLESLTEAGIDVTGIGKIGSIFAYRGITDDRPTRDNEHGIDETIQCIRDREGLIFTNLVDFDAKYGHRRDPVGYGRALEAFDRRLPEILDALHPGDLLMITADHGNDPTFRGTDHTREYVPILACIVGSGGGQHLGTRSSFADLGATLAEYFQVDWKVGNGFLSDMVETR
jgi:phosphopentomutase